jgi:hypothetical protein
MPRERVRFHALPHQAIQPIESLAHIRRPHRQVHPRGFSYAEHPRRRLLPFPPQPQRQRGNANSPAHRKVTLCLPACVIRLDDLPDRTSSPPPAKLVVHRGHYAAITRSRARWVALTHTNDRRASKRRLAEKIWMRSATNMSQQLGRRKRDAGKNPPKLLKAWANQSKIAA